MTSVSTGTSPVGDPPATQKSTSDDVLSAQAQRRNKTLKKQQSSNHHGITSNKEPKFEGRVEGLTGHIYDCSYKQADTYTRTTKEIAEYVGRTFNLIIPVGYVRMKFFVTSRWLRHPQTSTREIL
jgi:hypothetical protein